MAANFSEFWKSLARPKRLSILVGALMAVIGSAGQFFFVENLSTQSTELAGKIAAGRANAESLKSAQLQYFIAFQQGSVLFAMEPGGMTKDKQLLGNLYQLNLISRATPLRTMLGEMAIAGVLDYRKTYDAYSAVNEKARAEFTWENYAALNALERDILDRALTRQHALETTALDMQSEKAAVDQVVDRRKLTLVLLSLFGNFLLLYANLRSA